MLGELHHVCRHRTFISIHLVGLIARGLLVGTRQTVMMSPFHPSVERCNSGMRKHMESVLSMAGQWMNQHYTLWITPAGAIVTGFTVHPIFFLRA